MSLKIVMRHLLGCLQAWVKASRSQIDVFTFKSFIRLLSGAEESLVENKIERNSKHCPQIELFYAFYIIEEQVRTLIAFTL